MSHSFLSGKRVLVTGGTGSFGNFVVRRLLDAGAREVRVFSRDEKKQHDMRLFYRARPELSLLIGDVRDRERVEEAMSGIELVFHAAALKQVPACEHHPLEAVQTNVLGAQNLLEAALRHGVQAFVAISTDKAVKPVNVMGMTKALQERLVQNANRSRRNRGTRFSCVRYGNVLRSRGSIVPVFRRQLKLGQRITITDERMTRFLLTLNDAIDLVLFAAEHGEGGEIFVRKAPAARVVDIAAVLCAEVGRPFEFESIGMLPGEKLGEILVTEEELLRVRDLGDYFKILPWWSRATPRELDREYGSSDGPVGRDVIRELIGRADKEFEAMEIGGGEFALF